MKKLLLILAFLSTTLFMMAQENPKQREIGLVFSNLNNFGLTFKTGTEKSLWRFSTLYLSGNMSTQKDDISKTTNTSNGFGISAGKEFRVPIVEHLEFRYGFDVFFSFSQSKEENTDASLPSQDRTQTSTTYQPGVNMVLGFYYAVQNKLVIGAEFLPFISYTTGTSIVKSTYLEGSEEKTTNSGFTYGLNTTSVQVSIAYRFGKKK
jgi:hypothetical protein